jgi:protein required for attachment to host cells
MIRASFSTVTAMTDLIIPHDAYVFVGDGRKALVLRNVGSAAAPHLETERVFVDQKNPSTHEQGSDRPGSSHSSVGPRRSSVTQTDWHDLEEHKFAHDVASTLGRIVRERKVKTLIVVAPPRALADLRKAFADEVKSKIVAEIDNDLTRHPVADITKHLVG